MNEKNEEIEPTVQLDCYRCPISREIMLHPLTTNTGHTYEAAELLTYLKEISTSCPMTRQLITHVAYNYTLKRIIALSTSNTEYEYYEVNPVLQQIAAILNQDKTYFGNYTFWDKTRETYEKYLPLIVFLQACYLLVDTTDQADNAALFFILLITAIPSLMLCNDNYKANKLFSL